MKAKLKKDLVIPAGTIFDDIVPETTVRNTDAFICYTLGFGRNAAGDLYIGHEFGDEEFDEWFERYPIQVEL